MFWSVIKYVLLVVFVLIIVGSIAVNGTNQPETSITPVQSGSKFNY